MRSEQLLLSQRSTQQLRRTHPLVGAGTDGPGRDGVCRWCPGPGKAARRSLLLGDGRPLGPVWRRRRGALINRGKNDRQGNPFGGNRGFGSGRAESERGRPGSMRTGVPGGTCSMAKVALRLRASVLGDSIAVNYRGVGIGATRGLSGFSLTKAKSVFRALSCAELTIP